MKSPSDKTFLDQASELDVDAFFDAALDLLCIADTSGNFLKLNREWEKVLGYSRQELLNRQFITFVHPDDVEPTLETLSQLRDQKEVLNFVNRYRHKDGSYRWIEWRSVPVGNLIYAAARDITDRIATELALKEKSAHIASILKASPTGIGMVVNRVFVDVNERICEMTGYSREELLGQNSRMLYPSQEEYERVGKEKYEQISAYGIGSIETLWQRKDGRIINVLLSSAPINPENWQEGVTFTATDITARIQAEEDRRKYEQQVEEHKRLFYRETIKSVTDGKLDIALGEDVQRYYETSELAEDFHFASDAWRIRKIIETFCRSKGLCDEPLGLFITGVGEAINNAIKHAGGGTIRAGILNNAVWVGISDKGPGIETLALPGATLRRGFSTKPSLGMGYSIMLDVADRIVLHTESYGTTVILMKNLIPSSIGLSMEELLDTWDSIV